MNGYIYPDGGPPLDQPCLLLDAFATIGDALAKEREAKKGES